MEAALETKRRNDELRTKMKEAGIALTTRPQTMREVAEEFAWNRGVTLEQLIGPDRKRAITRPRQELMSLLCEQLDARGQRRWSSTRIGQFLGGRDHTTVLHGCRTHRNRRDDEAALEAREEAIARRFGL